MLTVISDFEAANDARERLNKALLLLAQAQVEVSEAASTLRMFETNFRNKADAARDTVTTTDNGRMAGVHFYNPLRPPHYDWSEVTGRGLCGKWLIQDEVGTGPRCEKPIGHPEPCQSY